MREKLWSLSYKQGFKNPLWETRIEKDLLRETVALWIAVVSQDKIDQVDAQVALGAHYAKLVSDGEVRVSESGVKKIKLAHEALTLIATAGE